MNEQGEKIISFFHAVNSGDLIANLSGIRAACTKDDCKAIIYQQLDLPGHYYKGATHPLTDGVGNLVTMNAGMLNMLKPLIESQDYIEKIQPYDGEKVDVDLHRIHKGTFVNMPYGPIQMWPWFVFPFMRCDLSEPWISVPENKGINVSGVNNKYPRKIEDCLVINFTERYRNTAIKYFFLRKYQDRIIFAGTQDEYKLFTAQWRLDIPYLQVNDFLELAQVIASCKAFMGNQSMCWNIAEAMKVPRMCEYFAQAPNCFPFGKNGVLYMYEGDAEDATKKFMDTDMQVSVKGPQLACPVCGINNNVSFTKSQVAYHYCRACGTLYSKFLEQGNMLGGLHGDETVVRRQQNEGRIKRIKALGCVTLLDFGCGTGELVKDAAGSGLQVLGYDKYSPEYSSMPAGEFDCVSMVEVIEHTYYPYSELDLVHDALKQGGFVYVETSFSDFLIQSDDYIDPDKGHHTIWSFKGMDMQMDKHGFDLHEVINQNVRVYKKSEFE